MFPQWLRVLAALIVMPVFYTFAFRLDMPDRQLLAPVVAILAAGMLWWGLGQRRPGIIVCMLLGMILLGGAGFAIGFFGPLLLMPGVSQAPLLGTLFTGPLGVLFGLPAGMLLWWWRHHPF